MPVADPSRRSQLMPRFLQTSHEERAAVEAFWSERAKTRPRAETGHGKSGKDKSIGKEKGMVKEKGNEKGKVGGRAVTCPRAVTGQGKGGKDKEGIKRSKERRLLLKTPEDYLNEGYAEGHA